VIISTYSAQRTASLLRCVNSLLRQSYPESEREIIVVVDRSQQLALAIGKILPPGICILVCDKPGLSEARNSGATHATGEIVAHIDDDAIADVTWIEKLVRNYEDNQVIAAGGSIKPIWPGLKPEWIPESLYWVIGCTYSGLPRTKQQVRNVLGANMSHRKEVINLTRFKAMLGKSLSKGMTLVADETEFFINLSRVFPNGRILFDPEAIVHHYVPSERLCIIYFIKRAFAEGVSKATISMRYGFASLTDERNFFRSALRELGNRQIFKVSKVRELRRALSQTIALVLVVSATVLGFLVCLFDGILRFSQIPVYGPDG
jgi:glycosyltransferase involved in cell wall biosynthesis